MVKSATRTLDILEAVAAAPDGLTHTAIAQALRIPKSSLTGLLRSLTARHYLALAPATGIFRVGPRVLVLSRAFLAGLDVVKDLVPVMRALRDAADEAVTLAVWQNGEIVVVAQEPGRQPLTPVMRVGDRAPALLTASGKALAAFLDDAAIDALIAATARQTSAAPRLSPATLRRQLAEIRAGGFARVEEEWIAGVTAIGLPVFGADSAQPAAALAVALPTMRLTPASRPAIEAALRAAAQDASARLGSAGASEH